MISPVGCGLCAGAVVHALPWPCVVQSLLCNSAAVSSLCSLLRLHTATTSLTWVSFCCGRDRSVVQFTHGWCHIEKDLLSPSGAA